MGRRPCMCLAQLKHLLPFGPVAGAACCRAGGHYQGGAGRVVTRRSEWVLPRRGPGGCSRGGASGFEASRGGFYRGGLLLLIVLSLALRPFCESYEERAFGVSNTINIITYIDV